MIREFVGGPMDGTKIPLDDDDLTHYYFNNNISNLKIWVVNPFKR